MNCCKSGLAPRLNFFVNWISLKPKNGTCGIARMHSIKKKAGCQEYEINQEAPPLKEYGASHYCQDQPHHQTSAQHITKIDMFKM